MMFWHLRKTPFSSGRDHFQGQQRTQIGGWGCHPEPRLLCLALTSQKATLLCLNHSRAGVRQLGIAPVARREPDYWNYPVLNHSLCPALRFPQKPQQRLCPNLTGPPVSWPPCSLSALALCDTVLWLSVSRTCEYNKLFCFPEPLFLWPLLTYHLLTTTK